MDGIQIYFLQNTLVLRHKHSELVIIPQHVDNLKKLENPKDFSQYFLDHALVNRSARKLFVAWLRKDAGIWKRIFQTINSEEATEKKGA